MLSLLGLVRFPSAYIVLAVTIAPAFIVKFAWYQQLLDFMLTSSFLYSHDPRVPEAYDFIVGMLFM